MYGIRGIIVHHYFDRKNDEISGEYNLFQTFKKQSVFKLTSLFYFLEIAFRTLTLWKLVCFLNPMISENQSLLTHALFVISLVFTLTDIINFFRKLPPNPFASNWNDVFNQKAVICCFLIQFGSANYLFLIISISLLVLLFSFNQWLPFQIFLAQVSLLINHFIYECLYAFRGVLPKSVWRKNIKNWKLTHQKKHKRTVAIFNENKDKYTETFIKGHVDFLPLNKVYYFGKLPVNIFPWGNVFSDNGFLSRFQNITFDFFGIDQRKVFKNKLSRSIKGRKINVVLAEFGTMGAQIYEACELAGVPLVVVFYGYDAWYKSTLDSNILKYKEMFSYSSKVIGVSLDICRQLEKLGCPKEKIEYLPCYVNLRQFSYSDYLGRHQIVLSVGRFSETKSPHLTILAFNEVLKEIPEAKLVLVGKDGGGELFEACHILVKALQIEDKVEFKGILTPREVKNEMDKASVFVQHSITTPINGDKEGTPVSIMEAMASGLPVVATNHAGIAELIKSGENGFLVEEFDYLSMAKQIVYCLNNLELMSEIGKNASHSIYSNELIVNHQKILQGILTESTKK
ncbi:MAG: glycosyltransferase [Crocinitomicaceae bacterium]|nr:glycosyltransferase [Crocinitomicaceae bacterium]